MPSNRKKSRKVGLIGVRKDPDFKQSRKPANQSKKTNKGRPAGSRNNLETTSKVSGGSKSAQQKDPRHGSKKPIALVVSPTVSKVQQRKFATPAEELAAIEADSRLTALLEKLDNNKSLTREQQHYVETMMARHQSLCELMGIDPEDEEDENDPFAQLDAVKIDDFTR